MIINVIVAWRIKTFYPLMVASSYEAEITEREAIEFWSKFENKIGKDTSYKGYSFHTFGMTVFWIFAADNNSYTKSGSANVQSPWYLAPLIVEQYGWPLPTISKSTGVGQSAVGRNVPLPVNLGGYGYKGQSQTQVNLLGFVINTLFYGGLVWLLYFLFRQYRARTRADSGLCLACGYDLRGNLKINTVTCPECGSEHDAELFERPKQVVRSWMIKCLVVATLIEILWFAGQIHEPWGYFHWHYLAVVFHPITLVLMVFAALWLGRAAYCDRTPFRRAVITSIVTPIMAVLVGLPIYGLYVIISSLD